MGLKVRALLSDKEIKERAKKRKAKSDAILDSIYELLLENKADQNGVSEQVKKVKIKGN
jgi:hypothetical protein